MTGPTTSEELSVSQYKNHRFEATISGIVTDVTIRVEVSVDKQTWVNLDDGDLVLDQDDVYNILVTPDYPVQFIRFNWVSQTGAGPTIELVYDGWY